MRLFYICFLVFFSSLTLSAQVQTVALQNNPYLSATARMQDDQVAVSRSEKGASLPFFDDFAYPGPYPDQDLWVDRHVFINNTLAYRPLSVGIATFDGLNFSGSPYGGSGSSDTLTSIALDLSGSSAKYLSYYIQPKGYGDAPGPEDKLVLEFKNISGDWIEVRAHSVTIEEALFPVDSLPEFQFVQPIQIDDPQYLHDDFQFRFRNFALRNGAVDMWHLDYVRLESTETDQFPEDLAFTSLPSNILLEYSSAPWIHIREEISSNPQLVLTTFDMFLYNHSLNTIGTSESELLINGIDNTDILRFRRQSLLDPFNDPEQENIISGAHHFTNPIRGEYRSAYRNEFKNTDRIQVQVDYRFTQNNSEPATTQRNNQVSRTFELDDYYAYDDNSAESALFIGTGGQVAVKYNNYKEDLLQGVRINIPRIVGDISESNFTLKVWLNDLNSEPVFEAPFTQPIFVDEFRDSLQAFTTYVFKDNLTGALSPVSLPVGEFFIGWEQVSPCGNVSCLPVGLDRNTPSATDKVYVNPEGNWGQFSDFFPGGVPVSLTGALMIRPVVGSEPPRDSEDALDVSELSVSQLMQIFPNPTSDLINIQLFEGNYADYQFRIINSMGQLLSEQTLIDQIDLSNYTPGLYFIQITHKQSRATGSYKLMLR